MPTDGSVPVMFGLGFNAEISKAVSGNAEWPPAYSQWFPFNTEHIPQSDWSYFESH